MDEKKMYEDLATDLKKMLLIQLQDPQNTERFIKACLERIQMTKDYIKQPNNKMIQQIYNLSRNVLGNFVDSEYNADTKTLVMNDHPEEYTAQELKDLLKKFKLPSDTKIVFEGYITENK